MFRGVDEIGYITFAHYLKRHLCIHVYSHSNSGLVVDPTVIFSTIPTLCMYAYCPPVISAAVGRAFSQSGLPAVSYTHLTLPTNREV